jgi:hypothetical protein
VQELFVQRDGVVPDGELVDADAFHPVSEIACAEIEAVPFAEWELVYEIELGAGKVIHGVAGVGRVIEFCVDEYDGPAGVPPFFEGFVVTEE